MNKTNRYVSYYHFFFFFLLWWFIGDTLFYTLNFIYSSRTLLFEYSVQRVIIVKHLTITAVLY